LFINKLNAFLFLKIFTTLGVEMPKNRSFDRYVHLLTGSLIADSRQPQRSQKRTIFLSTVLLFASCGVHLPLLRHPMPFALV
jgi:hypothetical protein